MSDTTNPTGQAFPDRGIPTSLNTLYQEVILDHYRRPRNTGALEGATHTITMNNPLCGDVIELELKIEEGLIQEARFIGRGCSISQASASMMTGRLKERTLDEARDLALKFTRLLHGEEALLGDSDLGDLRALAGVSKFPVRIKCALLGWNCLEELVRDGRDETSSATTSTENP
jgi:nitrogen fixation NifU-like protein